MIFLQKPGVQQSVLVPTGKMPQNPVTVLLRRRQTRTHPLPKLLQRRHGADTTLDMKMQAKSVIWKHISLATQCTIFCCTSILTFCVKSRQQILKKQRTGQNVHACEQGNSSNELVVLRNTPQCSKETSAGRKTKLTWARIISPSTGN